MFFAAELRCGFVGVVGYSIISIDQVLAFEEKLSGAARELIAKASIRMLRLIPGVPHGMHAYGNDQPGEKYAHDAQ